MNSGDIILGAAYQGVLFDLDGTLLDTYCDLANALNRTLVADGRKPHDPQQLRAYVSTGAMRMICHATGLAAESPLANRYYAEMLAEYADDIATHTQLFPGIDRVLEHIQRYNLPWGIVTNKPGYLTDRLLAELQLAWNPGVIISGDTLAAKKPDPTPLLEACKRLRIVPQQAVYVGDGRVDIVAGQRAGMDTIAVTYGYCPPDDSPYSWAADHLVHNAADIARLLTP